jgi:hypothetical protein
MLGIPGALFAKIYLLHIFQTPPNAAFLIK